MPAEVRAFRPKSLGRRGKDVQVVVVQQVAPHRCRVGIRLTLADHHLHLDRQRFELAQHLLGQLGVGLAHARVRQVVVRHGLVDSRNLALQRVLLVGNRVGLLEGLDLALQPGLGVQVVGDPSRGLAEDGLTTGNVTTNSVESDGSFTTTVRPEARSSEFNSSTMRSKGDIGSLGALLEVLDGFCVTGVSNKIGLNQPVPERQPGQARLPDDRLDLLEAQGLRQLPSVDRGGVRAVRSDQEFDLRVDGLQRLLEG